VLESEPPRIRCFAAGRPARKTNGSARAAMSRTHLTREASAQLASISGMRPSVFRAADGRRIRSGTRIREKREAVT
jgi:hypothetical protein